MTSDKSAAAPEAEALAEAVTALAAAHAAAVAMADAAGHARRVAQLNEAAIAAALARAVADPADPGWRTLLDATARVAAAAVADFAALSREALNLAARARGGGDASAPPGAEGPAEE